MKQNLTKIIIGGILILLGGFFFLRTIGIIPTPGVTFWDIIGFIWPAILLWIGIKMLIESNFTPGIIFISLAIVFLLKHLFGWGFFSILWPIILIAIGISIFFKNENDDVNSSSKIDENERIKDTVVFWGVDKQLISKNFKDADVNIVFGGYKIDMTKVKIAKKGAEINLNVAFGGAEIIVPREYKIITKGTGVFGGWKSKIDNERRKAPTITIQGTAIFGGVEVKEV